jgi:chorismate mutase
VTRLHATRLPPMRLYALRGATSVGADEREAILAATTELMHELLARNELVADDIVSCLFTLTPDLHAEFPAVAAREMGLSSVPLMCAQELAVPGSMPRVIRVMVHCYLGDGRSPQHVYLGDAARLRLDLQGAQ